MGEAGAGLLAESELLRDRTCCTLNYICNLLGMGDVDRVAGACDFDRVALGPLGIPTFQIGVNGSVGSRHQHPAWFGSPGSGGDRR